MNIEKLKEVKDKSEIKANKIKRLLAKKEEIERALVDLAYMKRHAGVMLFQGRTGKIGDEEILRTIKINTLSGCVVVPELLMSLANEMLEKLEHEADGLVLPDTEEE